jgi:uncharacterized damage-inducible protein DinB
MNQVANDGRLGQLFLEHACGHLQDESLPRILKCLEVADNTLIWHRANAETVSIGNLVLHLCGNVRQWILSGVAGETDCRTRDAEFDETGPVPTEELATRLTSTVEAACTLLRSLDPTVLTEPRRVQGFDTTVIGIVVHVVEHFSYHTGQISYMVKAAQAVDLQYYKGHDLTITD